MSAPNSPTHNSPISGRRRRASSAARATQSAINFTEDLVLNRDPPAGFFAASAAATNRTPTVGDVRRGSFGEDGWQARGSRRSTRSSRGQSAGSRDKPALQSDAHGHLDTFAPLTEESTQVSSDLSRLRTEAKERGAVSEDATVEETPEPGVSSVERERTDHDRISPSSMEKSSTEAEEAQSLQTSEADAKAKTPWTKSTAIALKAFWKWFLTPFGFFLTLYSLNVVAWGGMLFLLLCNASPYMCWAPVHTKENQKHVSDVTALNFPGPYYYNCNDINSPRRIWIEIDSQILNALFCVTGFGLAPWRFRDLYYLLRYRFTSWKKGREEKMYALRVLAGIYKGWVRLPGSETLDSMSTKEYLENQEKTEGAATPTTIDLEANASSDPRHDVRIPLPVSKKPADPPTGVRAPPTSLWRIDFFVWCMVWNTFLQCCLCGFMWGLNRYDRPPWSTGLFVALACIIAGVGGIMSYVEGRRIKKVEGVPNKVQEQNSDATEDGNELKEVKTEATGHESVHLSEEKGKSNGS